MLCCKSLCFIFLCQRWLVVYTSLFYCLWRWEKSVILLCILQYSWVFRNMKIKAIFNSHTFECSFSLPWMLNLCLYLYFCCEIPGIKNLVHNAQQTCACQNCSISNSERFKRRSIKRGFHCIYTLNGRYQMWILWQILKLSALVLCVGLYDVVSISA
jgi:hypothetical protein